MCDQMSERIEELDEFGTDGKTNDSFGGKIISTKCLPEVWATNRRRLN